MIIWLASYPRSGNTLLRIVLKTVFDRKTYSKHDDVNDIGADAAVAEEVGHQFLGATWPEAFEKMRATDELYLVKTHDAPEDEGKAIYIVRDGRSTCRSFYHYLKDFPHLGLLFSVRDVVAGFTPFGSWGEHLDAWQPLARPNTLLVKYEDLVANPTAEIARIAEFTGLTPQHEWQNNFEKLHEMNPKFFRAGTKNEAADALQGDDGDIFWDEYGDWMRKLGYPDPAAPIGDPRLAYRRFISDKGKEYFNLRERVYMAESQMPKLTAENQALLAQVQEHQSADDQSKQEQEKLAADFAASQNTLTGSMAEVEALRKQLDDEHETTAELRSTLTSSREEMKVKQAELHARMEEAREDSARQLQESVQARIAVQNELDVLRASNNSTVEELAKTSDELNAAGAELTAARADLATTRAELASERLQLQEAQALVGHSRVIVEQINAALEQSQASLADVTAKRNALAAHGVELEQQLTELRNALASQRAQAEELQQRVDEAGHLAETAQEQYTATLAEKTEAVDVLAKATVEMNKRVRMLLSSRLLRMGWKLGFGKTPLWDDPQQDALLHTATSYATRGSANGQAGEMLKKIINLGHGQRAGRDDMEAALQHLVDKGFRPKVVVDIGSAKGYWTLNAAWRWKSAEFFMIDPLAESEPDLKKICEDPRFHYILSAVGKEPGELLMNVTPDCDGSSLLEFPNPVADRQRRVPIETLDRLIESGRIKPPQFVKLDVQGFEMNVLEGGAKLFESAEVFIIEVNFFEFMPGCPRVQDIITYMAGRGFYPFDFAGFLRRPHENDLGQADIVFVRKDSPLVASNQW
jgi:FkbM family methyltransferase